MGNNLFQLACEEASNKRNKLREQGKERNFDFGFGCCMIWRECEWLLYKLARVFWFLCGITV